MTRKLIATLLAAILALTSLAGCAALAEADEPVTVVLAQNTDPATLDPHKTGGDQAANVWRNIYETLLTYDAEDNLIPVLATSYEQVSDLEWVFYLKEGVTFSNGEPFNAEAVGWNLDRADSEEYARQSFEYRTYYTAGNWEAIDEYTIKVTLDSVDLLFDRHMADVPMIAPGHGEEVGEEGLSTDPCGTGPYVFVSWEPDQEIVLEKNPNYHEGEPEVDTYIIRTIPEAATRVAEMLNGNVDILYDVNYEYIDMLEASGSIRMENKPTHRVEYIGFNTTEWTPNPELYDVRVRQALNYAIDREAIIQSIMGGYGEILTSIWRKDFPDYDDSIEGYTYDPEKAKELLAEAGYADGFDITLLTTDANHAKAGEVCQAVAAYLGAVGINCTVEIYDDATSRSIVINGQAQQLCPGMFDWNWASKPGLSDSTLTGVIRSDGMTSYNCLEGYDELIDEILACTTMEEKAPLHQELQQMLIDNPPFLYLFQLGSIYAISSRVDWSASGTQYILAKEMKVNA